jgi:DnaK suppressor protein
MSPKARRSKAGTKAGAKKKSRTAAVKGKKKTPKKAASRTTAARKKKSAAKRTTRARKKKTPSKGSVPATKRKKKAASRSKKPRRVRLGPRQIEHYRELLHEKHRGLTAAYQLSKGDSRSDLDDGTEDYIDYAVHSYAREFLLSLSEMDRKQLYLVEEALERLGRNEYGHCQQCQQPIHPKRLEVAPWARYCVPCQELEEQGLLPELSAEIDDEEASGDDEESEGEDEAEDDDEDDDDLIADSESA